MSEAERQRRRVKALRDAGPTAPDPTSRARPCSQLAHPRPQGDPNPGCADYPRMLYHPDGRTTIAATFEQHDRLNSDGWEMATPGVVSRLHRRPRQ